MNKIIEFSNREDLESGLKKTVFQVKEYGFYLVKQMIIKRLKPQKL